MPGHHELLTFLLLVGLAITAAKGAGWLSLRWGQPAVLGELLAGVVLGPTVLNLLGRPPFDAPSVGGGLFLLANLGVTLLMFVAGLETDLDQMRRVGKTATVAGVAGVIAPVGLGLAAALPFGFGLQRSLFMGIVLAATSVSITVQTLIELGRLNSKEGMTLLAAAVVDDVVALIVLSVFIAVGSGPANASSLLVVLARMALFFAAAIALGRLFRRALGAAAAAPVSEGLLWAALTLLLFYAWSAEALGGVAAITGAYLAGVLVAQAGFRDAVEHRLKPMTYALLVPIFFVSIGLQTNIRTLDPADIPLAVVVIAVAAASKVIGCGLGARLTGFTAAESLRVGVGMISRGEVGLIIAAVGLQTGLLADRGFAIMVLMVLATTLITPPLLRLAFGGTLKSEEAAIEVAFAEDEDREPTSSNAQPTSPRRGRDPS